jgi:hypothetical protein
VGKNGMEGKGLNKLKLGGERREGKLTQFRGKRGAEATSGPN